MTFPSLLGPFSYTQRRKHIQNSKKLPKRLQNTCCSNIGAIRSDHEGEFQNEKFINFCKKLGIFHNFSTPRTPEQNGVEERKNRSLEQLARTILNDSSLPKCFWADVVSIACYVMNCVLIRPILKKKKPRMSY